jgi:hypothetical protein
MNELNSDLQARNQCVNEMFDKTTAFKTKLLLWDLQLQSNNTTHFPILRTGKPTDAKTHAEEIQFFQQEFNTRFQDIRKYEGMSNLFSVSCNNNIKIVPAEDQMQVTDFQFNMTTFSDVRILSFYTVCSLDDKAPVLSDHAHMG